ncbi:GntR family transcriptional regulator [Streptomyces sp. SCSIO 30461]|uniref:GntR family transcriptional regulator n=1 Tax=Streptomyces sp. SCSIO 30461 TaxID=3118085 RepID=UPI0030CBE4F5
MGTTRLEAVQEPKHRHLKTVIGEALDSEFAVGQILPNERELAARFGVARATLRQALEQLTLEGRLQRRRGVGTTVAPPRMGVDVSTSSQDWPGGPGDAWESAGCLLTAPPTAVSIALGTDSDGDEQVHTVRRTLVRHGQPVAAELLYVPQVFAPEGTDVPSATAGAVEVLRALRRLPLDGQDRAVELGSAGADDAKQLDRLPGAPVLVVTTRYVSADRTAAVSVATYRADTCRLTFGD